MYGQGLLYIYIKLKEEFFFKYSHMLENGKETVAKANIIKIIWNGSQSD